MSVVTFSVAGAGNCVLVGGAAYVYAAVDGRGFVMPAHCPHRGGPLHLSETTADGAFLVCPWHSSRTRTARLRDRIPAVRSGSRVTAVLPASAGPGWSSARAENEEGDPDSTAVTVEHRPLSASLTSTCGSRG